MSLEPEQKLALAEANALSIYQQIESINDLSKNYNDSTVDIFLTKASRLEPLRTQYSTAVMEVETLKLQIDPAHRVSFSQKISAINDLIDNACTVQNTLLNGREQIRLNSLTATQTNRSSMSKSKIKMEPIKLPTFDGSPEKWTAFYQLYVELVHLNEDYTDLQRVTVLTTHLSGSARSIITGIPPTAENYDTLFETLVARFEDRRALGEHYLDRIFSFRACTQESEKNLNAFLETFVESSEAIKKLGIADNFDFVLLHLACKKLDSETVRLFDMEHRNVTVPTFASLVDFVRTQVKILGRTRKTPSSQSPPSSKPAAKSSNTFVVQKSEDSVNATTSQTGVCGCSSNHRQLYKCEQFTRLTPPQRWEAVKKRHACINCLSFGHGRSECRSTAKCNVSECNRSHHSLLHRSDGKFANSPTESDSTVTAPVKTVACCSTQDPIKSQTVLLATAIIRIRDQRGDFQNIRCLLDPGSESHLVSKETCERLGLDIHPAPMAVRGLGSAEIGVRGCALFTFYSRLDEKSSYEVSALVVDKLIDSLPTVPIDSCNLEHVAHLTLADPSCLEVGKIDALIGAELWPYIVGHRKVFGPPNTPVGIQSKLGYLLMGRTSTESPRTVARVCLVNKEETALDELLLRFWELDTIPEARRSSPDDQKCEEIFLKTHRRCDDGRYMVALPFKEPPTVLGNSFTSCRSRFFSMERKLMQTPQMHSQYGKVIEEYLADGTVEKLDEVDVKETAFYLPHHGVYKPSSLTTPLRIVYNASAQSSSGKSLNDILYVGEKLQKDVLSILLNMRLFEHVLCTDIRRMFLRIRIVPEHRRFLRFLWRSSPQTPLQVLEFTSLVFGLTCSPFLAQRVIKALCADEGDKFPLAKEVIERDAYIDDLTTSVQKESQLFELYDQLTALFAAGGFSLSKWSSTSPTLLAKVPEDARQTQNISFDKDGFTKVLGVQWHPHTDLFSCSIHVDEERPTKRSMASLLARIFDPLGLVSPVTVLVKRLIREMWLTKLDWDAPPSEELAEKCLELKRSLSQLTTFNVPRFSNITEKAETMLVGFSDASEKAYGAVVYVRTHEPPAPPQVRLLCSRSVIAPMKPETIPRLELCAAVVLAKLMRHVVNTYQDRHKFDKIVAFSDSTVTVHWVRSHPSQWKVFVANRVAQIQENIDPLCWRYVRGHENPADILSRGATPAELLSSRLWISGPDWLAKREGAWPLCIPEYLQQDVLYKEVKPRVLVIAKIPPSPLEPMLERVSQYRRLLRATAHVFRICRKKDIGEPVISYEELCNAEMYWVKLIQSKHFAEVIGRLTMGKPLPDEYKRLDVFLKDGVLRVGGRIRHANISMQSKHPILLPKHDRFVNLLIDQYHIDHFHAGAYLLLSYISQKFWIMSAGVRIHSRLRCCHTCFRHHPKEVQPKMADLPKLRVQGYKSFATAGVDYAGPFPITWSRRRGVRTEKAYVCLFVCFATRAVHIELVTDLSTANFLSAFKRFLARRGPCARLVSDCGSNFCGAKRELAEIHQLMSSRQFEEQVGNDLAARGVTWQFNPARAPHFGGLWESNIKSMKTHLKKIIGPHILTYEEMNTVLVQIEAIMNSRPLCKRPLRDPTAPAALTPAHFLTLGSTLDHLPMEDVMHLPLNRLNRFQLIDRFVQDFWKRWKTEYLHTLQLRSKWLDPATPIKVGSVVVLKEDNVLPLRWPLAVVEAVHPGQDGEIRVVTVRTATSTFKRPVVKVCPLPSSE